MCPLLERRRQDVSVFAVNVHPRAGSFGVALDFAAVLCTIEFQLGYLVPPRALPEEFGLPSASELAVRLVLLNAVRSCDLIFFNEFCFYIVI